MKKLVIHADDFGLSEGINQGILKSILSGVVSSVSLLANFPSSLSALKLADRHSLDIGWHINFTLGFPISPPRSIPSLVQKDGRFHSLYSLILRSLCHQIKEEEIERELNAQFEFFVRHRVPITHIDGHQHSQVLPVISKTLRSWIQKRSFPFFRIPREIRTPFLSRLPARLFLNSLPACRPAYWKISALPFYGISMEGRADKIETWKTLLGHLSSLDQDLFEIMVHPGSPRPDENLYGDDFLGDRQKELEILTSSELKKLIEDRGFKRTDFRTSYASSLF